jgi:hypothetical protein
MQPNEVAFKAEMQEKTPAKHTQMHITSGGDFHSKDQHHSKSRHYGFPMIAAPMKREQAQKEEDAKETNESIEKILEWEKDSREVLTCVARPWAWRFWFICSSSGRLLLATHSDLLLGTPSNSLPSILLRGLFVASFDIVLMISGIAVVILNLHHFYLCYISATKAAVSVTAGCGTLLVPIIAAQAAGRSWLLKIGICMAISSRVILIFTLKLTSGASVEVIWQRAASVAFAELASIVFIAGLYHISSFCFPRVALRQQKLQPAHAYSSL